MTTPIIRMNPKSLPDASEMGYSQVSIVEPGRMAFISGQVAWQAEGSPVPKDIVGQMQVVARNVLSALESIGASPHDVVIARIYVVDLTPEHLQQLMPEFLKAFDGAEPSVTGIGVAALAAPDLQIEMELVVRVPD